jgi:Carboxypeptidase regulatory-like domain
MLIQTALSAILAMSISGVRPPGPALVGSISGGSAAVAGAIVTISNRGFVQSTTTDENGRFLLQPVPPGRYDFRTSAQGYAVFECPVVVHGGDSHRNRISVTALVPVNQQTVSVTDLRHHPQPGVAIGDRGQFANWHPSFQ